MGEIEDDAGGREQEGETIRGTEAEAENRCGEERVTVRMG